MKTSKQVQELVAVPNNSTDVFDQPSSSEPLTGPLHKLKLKVGKKTTDIVDGMLLASLQEKARKWRKEYECAEEDSSEEHTYRNESNDIKNDIKNCPTKEEYENSYFQLTKTLNAKWEFENDSSPSVLLPAYVPPLEDINVQVKGSNGLAKLSAKHYIGCLVTERNEAVLSAQLFRNQVDQLQSKNRKLYCEMHDRIDTIRNFWRNNIAEGSSRAGIYLKMALQKPKSQ